MAYLSVRDLSLGYDGKAILSGLSFNVNEGDYLCIVGENGSGKSTLMKTLLKLTPPLGGTIEFGEGIEAAGIGYLPQQTLVQRDFPASVYEIVISGCQSRSRSRFFYTKSDHEMAEKNIERMQISDLKDRCYRDLSGGQQQRVLLARALCAAQKILLLDEPVTGLDPKVSAELYNVIRDLNQQGMTIIMISHDIAAAINYASHILHIGEKVYFGTRDDYMKSRLGKYFLESAQEA